MKIVNILLILILCIGTASAATIKVEPHIVGPGSPVTVDIIVDPQGANVAGWEFAYVFDPAIVEVTSVTEGSFLKPSSTFFLAGTIDNVAGKVTGTTAAITTPGASVNAPGIAATINMKIKPISGPLTSPLTLQSVTIGDINGAPLPVTIYSGEIVFPFPEIASIGLVALGLIGLIIIRKNHSTAIIGGIKKS